MEELERRLRSTGINSEQTIQAKLRLAEEISEQLEALSFYDKVIVNEDLAKTYDELEQFVFPNNDLDRSSEQSQGTGNPPQEVTMATGQ
jgi:guanylate kinase